MKETPVQRFATEIDAVEKAMISIVGCNPSPSVIPYFRERIAAILDKVAEDAAEQERDQPLVARMGH